jgi:hypothetical protein
MPRQKKLSIIASFIPVLVVACSLQGVPVFREPSQEPTLLLETLVAEALTSTSVAQTVLANTATATLVAMANNTPGFTYTPPFTPTPTFTLTPVVPVVSVSEPTNCRSGPGTVYDVLGYFNVGQTAEVVGRSALSDYWIIKLPSKPAVTCWVWGKYASVIGDTSGLPVKASPPTPTPLFTPTLLASFDGIYSSTTLCSGLYGIKFQITNNGGVTWESNRIIATDQATSETTTVIRDNFPNLNGCSVTSADLNLEAGEVGITTSAGFSTNPAGHSITTTIRVCSLDGMAGTCLEKTITFTP